MKYLSMALLAGCVLVACSTLDVSEVTGPDGKKNYSLTCEEPFDTCYKKAAELCPGGYNINHSANAGEKDRGVWGKSQKTNMLISCK